MSKLLTQSGRGPWWLVCLSVREMRWPSNFPPQPSFSYAYARCNLFSTEVSYSLVPHYPPISAQCGPSRKPSLDLRNRLRSPFFERLPIVTWGNLKVRITNNYIGTHWNKKYMECLQASRTDEIDIHFIHLKECVEVLETKGEVCVRSILESAFRDMHSNHPET